MSITRKQKDKSLVRTTQTTTTRPTTTTTPSTTTTPTTTTTIRQEFTIVPIAPVEPVQDVKDDYDDYTEFEPGQVILKTRTRKLFLKSHRTY
ncbi:hypothetical protein ANCDUO_09723 [Ancylostoma duodenale]|uniref:Uncharacterized protein n=1 Tax=Ancylostoma duodenale TaxID=51022 RepID=A0A0C2CT24_9BILA|nr:hypothetical protein ANCDUO_09723 [Ancylostoma duodenale]